MVLPASGPRQRRGGLQYRTRSGFQRSLRSTEQPAPRTHGPARSARSRPPTRAVRAQFRFDARYEVDGQLRTSDYQPKVATDVVGLNPGPDGKIYGSTIISMHIFSFDPASRALEDLGRVGWGGGEIYDVIAHRDRLYMGSYSGGYWGVYDPERPWNPPG